MYIRMLKAPTCILYLILSSTMQSNWMTLRTRCDLSNLDSSMRIMINLFKTGRKHFLFWSSRCRISICDNCSQSEWMSFRSYSSSHTPEERSLRHILLAFSLAVLIISVLLTAFLHVIDFHLLFQTELMCWVSDNNGICRNQLSKYRLVLIQTN